MKITIEIPKSALFEAPRALSEQEITNLISEAKVNIEYSAEEDKCKKVMMAIGQNALTKAFSDFMNNSGKHK